jgi:hypothetical protein
MLETRETRADAVHRREVELTRQLERGLRSPAMLLDLKGDGLSVEVGHSQRGWRSAPRVMRLGAVLLNE